jgi:hypothetical protein
MGADPQDSVCEKVAAIFRELASERACEVDGSRLSIRTRDAIAAALAEAYDDDIAAKLSVHMSDWNGDAAFIVALHLFPERFTPDEIRTGIGMFLGHAPNHIAEACRLTGTYVWEDFPYDSDEQAEHA